MATLQKSANAPPLVQFLLRPESYPDRPGCVELVETHISWVFLTNRHAYKLKKPVQFEFLDFTTAEARRAACEDEIRLNRRLAADVYLDVVPITADAAGKFSLDGPGTAVDWLVRMRRLPADRTLEHLIQTNALSTDDIGLVAATLADFYSRLPPQTVTPQQYRETIEHHVNANFQELSDPSHDVPLALVRRIHSAQLQFLRLASHLLDERVCDGRIVEGHGDLRPEHIYLESTPVVIDCVEFSRELRILDVADELCFFTMECERLGESDVGWQIIEAYSRQSNDYPPQVLLDFYASYRACVRAKVAQLREMQLHGTEKDPRRKLVLKYLALADRYASKIRKPLLIIVRGLMGTGKSTLAGQLAGPLGAELLGTDVLRRELFPNVGLPESYGKGIYREEDRRRVYTVMMARAKQLLQEGMSVVLDGTFLTADLRTEAWQLAQKTAAHLLVVRCHCPGEIAVRRIADRMARHEALSDARPDLYAAQQNDEQPDPPELPSLDIDTTKEMCEQLDGVYDRLSSDLKWQ